MSVMICFFCWC